MEGHLTKNQFTEVTDMTNKLTQSLTFASKYANTYNNLLPKYCEPVVNICPTIK